MISGYLIFLLTFFSFKLLWPAELLHPTGQDVEFFDNLDMSSNSILDCNQITCARCHVESRLELEEVSPDAPLQLNTATLFAKDNGSSKTQLMVRFGSGAAIQLAIEV